MESFGLGTRGTIHLKERKIPSLLISLIFRGKRDDVSYHDIYNQFNKNCKSYDFTISYLLRTVENIVRKSKMIPQNIL